MDFVLTLHTHLPYVLNHGRWPHGSDWLCEAMTDTYLPLLEALVEAHEVRPAREVGGGEGGPQGATALQVPPWLVPLALELLRKILVK